MNKDYYRHHCGHTPHSRETQDPIMSHELRSAPKAERKGSLMCAQSVSVFKSATSPVDPSRALVENANSRKLRHGSMIMRTTESIQTF